MEERIRLLVWTQALLLDGELATAEPKRLRLPPDLRYLALATRADQRIHPPRRLSRPAT